MRTFLILITLTLIPAAAAAQGTTPSADEGRREWEQLRKRFNEPRSYNLITSGMWTLTHAGESKKEIEEGGRVDPELVASRFAVWHRRGRVTGVGASTYKALTELAAGGHWAFSGAKGERAAGNGAPMRVAPVAFILDPSKESERRTIRDVCRITHHHEEAYAGALAVVVALRAAFSGKWQRDDDLLDVVICALPDSGVKDRLEDLKGLGTDIHLSEVGARFGTSGYVAESVPFAIYGAQRVRRLGFKGLLKELIRAGGDTDTVSSIAGQICGAHLGVSGLPSELLEKLPEKGLVEGIARKFADKLG